MTANIVMNTVFFLPYSTSVARTGTKNNAPELSVRKRKNELIPHTNIYGLEFHFDVCAAQ